MVGVKYKMTLSKQALLCVGLLAAGCLAGCSNKSNDTGTTVKLNPVEQQKKVEDQIKAVQSNPNIPPQQKQAILSQMSRAGKPAGEASVLSRKDANGNVSPPSTTK